nr:DNA-binding protein HEXBP-like [Drosophila kikkawai]
MVTSLMARWKSLSVEQIAVSVTLAHAAGIDTRLRRLVFTTDIKSRNELHQELKAFSFDAGQRQHSSDNVSAPEGKRDRAMPHITCYNCGKPGHKKAECRFNKETTHLEQPRNNQQSGYRGASVICYKCGKSGHVSAVCPDRQERPPVTTNTIKDVNICTVLDP